MRSSLVDYNIPIIVNGVAFRFAERNFRYFHGWGYFVIYLFNINLYDELYALAGCC